MRFPLKSALRYEGNKILISEELNRDGEDTHHPVKLFNFTYIESGKVDKIKDRKDAYDLESNCKRESIYG